MTATTIFSLSRYPPFPGFARPGGVKLIHPAARVRVASVTESISDRDKDEARPGQQTSPIRCSQRILFAEHEPRQEHGHPRYRAVITTAIPNRPVRVART